MPVRTKSSGRIIKGGLKIEGCKIEGLLYQKVIYGEGTAQLDSALRDFERSKSMTLSF